MSGLYISVFWFIVYVSPWKPNVFLKPLGK